MQRVKIALKLFLLLLITYFVLRIAFYFVYFHPFKVSFSDNARIFYWGARMDISALFYINIPFLAYYFLIAFLLPSEWERRVSLVLFSVINLLFIALNVIDIVYFHYNLRRSTIDILHVFHDSMGSFGSLFREYWFVLLAFVGLAYLFVYFSKKIIYQSIIARGKWYLRWLASLGLVAVLLFLARGGDKRPIVPATALLHADITYQPVINNSTLNFLYSWLRATSRLERKDYFTATQLDSIYTIRRQYNHEQGLQKKNVVVFILESFTADFFKNGPYRARTPFFDSIMNKSIVFNRAYANGHESVMGLTAILGSLPPFTYEPLFISNYNVVPFRGIGTLLKEEGYNTNFFLGAEYDHFNFAKLCRMTGIDNYYSKDSYSHSATDEDGNWGMYDGAFFPYVAQTLAQKKQPFFSVLFNISSHPPFAIPPSQRNQFNIPGQDAQLNSITYVDHCFDELFKQIKNQPWFSNTIFVFCADHTLVEYSDYKSYQYNAYHIPLFIYDPDDTTGTVITKPVQQLDIVPSILDRIGYSKPFMSFGHSFFRNEPAFSICKKNDGYQLIDSTTLTGFDDRSGNVLYHYNYTSDSSLSKNLYAPNDPAIMQREALIKAIIQRFNNSLLDQQLMIRQ